MTIYEELLSRVEQGEKFSIDFEKRDMKVGKDWLIKDGVWDTTRALDVSLPIATVLEIIETHYKDYKYSTPSERSDGKRKCYFKALPVDELTDEQMVYGMNREYAQAKLEGYILCMILRGHLKWKDEWGSWFWASKEDKDLILLKKWIEGGN